MTEQSSGKSDVPRESDRRLEDAGVWRDALIDAALDAVIVIDSNGFIVDFNPAAEATFGYEKEEILGKRMSDFIVPPSLRQAHVDGLSRLKETQIPRILGKRLELPAFRSDGSEFPVELIVVEVQIDPSPLYVGYVRDISDRKQAEEALRASAKRFQALADSAPLMIWLADRSGTVEWLNRSWLQFTGRNLEDVLGAEWSDVLHPDDREAYFESYRQLLDAGDAFSMEFRLRHASGSFHWVLGTVAPTLNPDGSISGFAGSCVDITSRREAEKALRLTQFAVDDAADSIFWVRPDGSLQYVNDQACRSLGYTREELLAMKVTDFSTRDPFDDWGAHWENIRHEQHLNFETTHRRKDGREFPVEILENHIRFQDDEFICAFVRDITERREAQEKLADAMHEAQAANRAKSEFLAIVSHEMRTPLNSILGTIDLTLQQKLDHQQLEMISLCRQSGLHLKELINDMLDYSQIQAGRFSLQSRTMDVRLLLDRLRDTFSQRVQEKGLEFRWHAPRDIPSRLVGDERRLSQVIENLLNNAVKFTDTGYVAFRATHASETDGSIALRFEVEDTGVGIAHQHRERVFHRFEQVDSGPTRAFGGVGLGLSICRQLVELMDGGIFITDGSDGGSRFVFTAEFAKPDGEPATAAAKPPQIEGQFENRRLSGVTVLLAEDDPPSRLIAERMLRLGGVEVVTAADGAIAVEIFREAPERFDAVLMDIMMPQLDGIEATKRIREIELTRVPVIAMTAQAMVGDRERILQAQVDAYIAKPIDRQLLLSTLAELVSPRSLPTEKRSLGAAVNSRTFDIPRLRERCGSDDELISEIVQLFAQTCNESVQQIVAGLEHGDQPGVVNATHRLKGAAASMCAQRAFELCEELEGSARRADLGYVKARLPSLKAELKELREELEQFTGHSR